MRARRTAARPPRLHLGVAFECGHRVALRLALQLVEVAQALGANAFAHHAAGLVGVVAVAEAALRRQCGDVAEGRGEILRFAVQPQGAQPRRVDDAGAARHRVQRTHGGGVAAAVVARAVGAGELYRIAQ